MQSHHISEDIHLKLSHPLHAEKLYKAAKRNEKHLRPFLRWVAAMKTVEDFERYLTKCANEQHLRQEWSFNIFKNNNIIGRIGLHQIDLENKNACIGYWIDKAEVGKGIITTATKVLISYAFNELNLHRIEILTATHNLKSEAIPLRLGFQKEGVLRGTEKHDDQYYDLAVYSLLKPEWNSQT